MLAVVPRDPRITRSTVVAAAFVAAATTGCTPEPSDPSIVVLKPVATTAAPYSRIDDIALVTPDIACVIDSYEFRVRCGDRAGDVLGVFGRKGDGPGESRTLSALERGADGSVGIIDLGLNRLSFYATSGKLVSQVSMPRGFLPHKIFDQRVLGIRVEWTDQATGDGGTWIPREVDLLSGDVLWERSDLEDVADTECGKVRKGWPDGRGGFVFWACQDELVFLQHRDAKGASVVASPTYFEELPNQRDVDGYLTGIFAMGSEDYVAEYRKTPKRWFLTPEPINFDFEGRLWVATTRDRDTYSYIDVWNGQQYLGTLRIRDRLMGYDLLGTTFAALVERTPGPNGIARRAIDWYDISALDFGS